MISLMFEWGLIHILVKDIQLLRKWLQLLKSKQTNKKKNKPESTVMRGLKDWSLICKNVRDSEASMHGVWAW